MAAGVMAGALAAAVAAAGLAVWIRVAPVAPERWHVDPLVAERPGSAGWLIHPTNGDAEAPRVAQAPGALMAALDAAARSEPRTRRVAGSVEEGRITYETRSRIWGFPDCTTVTAIPDGDGARPVLLARSRFGRSDLGVNRARVERWLARVLAGSGGS